MADEYDAFGRKAGEDPLEGLGWSRPESGASSPVPVEPSEAPGWSRPASPVPAEPREAPGWSRPPSIPVPADPSDRKPGPAPARVAPPRPQPPPGRPPRRRRRSRAGVVIVAIILAVVGVPVLAIGGIVWSVTDEVRDAVDTPMTRPDVNRPGAAGGGDGDERPAPPDRPPRGLQRGSLILPANLELALRSLRAETDGQIKSLRLAPDRLDAQLVTRRGYIFHVDVSYEGGVVKGSRSGPGFPTTSTIPYSRISTTAPRRLVRAAAARMRRSPDGIDYLAVMEIGDGLLWSAFFKNGAIYQADGQGRIVRRAN